MVFRRTLRSRDSNAATADLQAALQAEIDRFRNLESADIFPVWQYPSFRAAFERANERACRTGLPVVLVQLARDDTPSTEVWDKLGEAEIPLVTVTNMHGKARNVSEALYTDTVEALRYRAMGLQTLTPPPVDDDAARRLDEAYSQMPEATEWMRRELLDEYYGYSEDDGTR